MANRIDREELRLLIREALREALGGEPPPPPNSGVPEFRPPNGRSGEHPTSVRGRDRKGGQPPVQHPSPSPTPPHKGEGKSARVESGVLSEAKVVELGRAHTKILVGGGVVVTPLARDKAREMKLEIARQKP